MVWVVAAEDSWRAFIRAQEIAGPNELSLRRVGADELVACVRADTEISVACIDLDTTPGGASLARELWTLSEGLHLLLFGARVAHERVTEHLPVCRHHLYLRTPLDPHGLASALQVLVDKAKLEKPTRTDASDLSFAIEALADSDLRFRALFEQSRDAILLVNFEGNLLAASTAVWRLLGRDRREIGAMSLETILAPRWIAIARGTISALRDGGPPNISECEVIESSGRLIPVEICWSTVTHAGKSVAAMGVARDVSGRKNMQQRLLLLQKAIETTRAGVSIKDTNNIIVYANPAEAAMHGYDAKDLIGQPASILGLPLAKRDLTRNQLVELSRLAHETVNLRKDGTAFPVRLTSDVVKDDSGEPIGVVSVCEDITSQVQAEQKIRRSEAQLRSLVARLPDAVAVVRDGHLVFANSTMITYLGFGSEQELLGRPLLELIDPGHRTSLADIDTWGPDSRRLIHDLRFLRRDGKATIAEACVMSLDFANEPAHLLVAHDTAEVVELRRTLGFERSFHGLVGESQGMQQLYELARQVACTAVPVLIAGETGTGKELLARAIHSESDRSDGPFVPVNCGALPGGLIESELFGHTRGAFTGAVRDTRGRFERANGGTIFLDEIGELPHAAQVKLLRALEEGHVDRVGSDVPVDIDVRVISATNRELRDEIDRGRFREDLYFRVCVVPLHLPPLRERGADIVLLAEHYLHLFSEQAQRVVPVLTDDTKRALLEWPWPGNVRELINTLQYALVKAPGRTIAPEHLPFERSKRSARRPSGRRPGRKPKLSEAEVENALKRAGGNKAKAAAALGVGRSTLYRYLDRDDR